MKRLSLAFAAIIFSTLALFNYPTSINAGSDKFKRSERPISGRYIVVLEDNADGTKRKNVPDHVQELAASYRGNVDRIYESALSGYAVEMTEDEAKRLSEDPSVKYVEEDSDVWSTETMADPAWALDRIDQRNLPLNNQFVYSAQGAGVNVYILDSGIMTTHEALIGRAFNDYDAVHDNTPIEQCNGHGTGVAGVAVGSGVGVARSAYVHSVRVLPCTGYGTVSDVLSGIDWVTCHAVKPAVANMSLQTTLSNTMNNAVAASIRSGVTYVVASGNNGADACSYSPSAVREAIVVGGTNSADYRLTYSNFGSCVDLLAPGEGVKTIWNSTPSTITYSSGTSFASPYVAGTAALYLEGNPLASPQAVQATIVSNATPGAIFDVGANSSNMLLYSLFEGGGDGGGDGSCGGTTFTGTISVSGSTQYQSAATGFAGTNGNYSGSITSSASRGFSLSLEKKSGSRWAVVGKELDGQVTYRGKNGTYRWRIASTGGVGEYSVCSIVP